MVHDAIQLVLHHGYAVLFVWVLWEQIGVPVPSLPILLACGALAAKGESRLVLAIAAATCAALLADNMWYQLGRLRGRKILRMLCRISLEPDSCVRRTEDTFARYGPGSLLFAKFVPGLGAVAVPLAGASRMKFASFMALDSLGIVIWSGTIICLGDIFSNQLERLAVFGIGAGAALGALVAGGLASWLGWKLYRRQKFLRQIQTHRVTPKELKARLDSGEDVVVVDLRHQLDHDASPAVLPGAMRVDPADIENGRLSIPKDREIILYCT
ncbi:MAG: VTT domain-containing protein [Terriglobia bacterium]